MLQRSRAHDKPAFLASPPRPDEVGTSSFDMRPDPTWTANPNIEWIYGRFTWIFYIGLLVFPTWLLTFIYLHWLKGNPFFYGQGKYDHLTFWEQLDNGKQYTYTRKFLVAVPLVLFLLSTHFTDYDPKWAIFNSATFVPIIIGKFASMHRVRIFGINRD